MHPPAVQRNITRLEGLIAEFNALEDVEVNTTRVVSSSTPQFGNYLSGDHTRRQPEVRVPLRYTHKKYDHSLFLRMKNALLSIAPNTVFSEDVNDESSMEPMRTRLSALLAEITAGHFNDQHELAHADVFDNMLHHADYLLSKGDKKLAAVEAGSAAETHLRQLAVKHLGSSDGDKGKPLMGGALNTALGTANVYALPAQQQMAAWQAIRNAAAHGKPEDFTEADVKAMIEGIRIFIAEYPA